MKFNVSDTEQLTLYTDFDFDIVDLHDGFCAYRMNVQKRYMLEPGLLKKKENYVKEGISEKSMILGGASEAEFNDALSWHKNFKPEMLVVD